MQPTSTHFPAGRLLAVLSVALLGAAPAAAQAAAKHRLAHPYELIVVEPSGASGFDATGCTDVSDQGVVVGRTWVAGVLRHYEWTSQGGFTFPTQPFPAAERRLNNAGDSIFQGGEDLVLADGTQIPIPDPLGTGVFGNVTDLNDALTLVGQGVSTGTTSGIFRWTMAGGSQGLPIDNARALRRINAQGVAVGYRLINTQRRALAVDVHSAAWIDLHAQLPATGASEAFDVNDLGQVVGFGPDGSSLSAWVWSAAGGFVFLPGLDGGESMYVIPRAIDNQGRVVGSARNAKGDYRAFLWEPGRGMIDLNGTVATGSLNLVEALDQSESGVIIGRGFHGLVWGPDRGFILDPK